MSFPLVGNLKLKTAVLNALSQKHIPHAILIEGDVGSGRHTLANFIARAAVCEGESIPCDNCHGCELQISGNHPDIAVIAPEENKDFLKLFSFICFLSFDVYMKKMMIQKLIDEIKTGESQKEETKDTK